MTHFGANAARRAGLRIAAVRPFSRMRSMALPGPRLLLAFLVFAPSAAFAAARERTVPLPDAEPLRFGWIEPGTFQRGSDENEAGRDRDEGPRHQVTLTKGFFLGVHEVTQGQWLAVMGENPSAFRHEADALLRPVDSVSWQECRRFIARLEARGLGRFRLPTEAEWEYAARAGTTTAYPWGGDARESAVHARAWANSRSAGTTHPVGTKPANPWGLFDLAGNVWEWCADWYGPYAGGPQTDPTGPATGTERVFRGGSWNDFAPAQRSANRHRHAPDGRYTAVGLRLVLEAEAPRPAPAAAPPRPERTVALGNGAGMRFVEVPAGAYAMGSPEAEPGRAADEGPVRRVEIPRPFFLGKFEVTQAQWRAVMGDNPSTFRDRDWADACPVERVSFHDAAQFIARLNARGAGTFRLPTEAEWEYAARAGATTRFPWGDDPDYRELRAHAWINGASEGRTRPVGEKKPNAWGLHDMLGNVWEWCADRYAPYGSEVAVPPAGVPRVIRGGSWFNEPEAQRPANRHRHPEESRLTNLGLRLVWEPPAVAAAKPLRPDGTVDYGYRAMRDLRTDPWHVPVAGHVAVAPGEYPRLLFRRGDLPALRAKAETPEGRAILQRLRRLLDGADGTGMAPHFNPATDARAPAAGPLPAGTYTFGHAAGYGLLYQLTGDARYAALGRECFERALAGTRDRDSRYSFRQPGGALRAGPTLGWMAVGYDLCRDGWDAATRERFGRALLDYREHLADTREGKQTVDLGSLARGTMPPYSNHFSMQVGGAALVLLALKGEPWADEARLAGLLAEVERGLVRNLSEGFGDGGFFAEGDGTGSMASQIVFLSALQAWRNVLGRDFIAGPRPNTRMLTLKWAYQTVFRDGRPEIWPVRGGYAHNVWARSGQSGAGYFAFGFGAVRAEERAALRWIYERFLAAADAAAGTPGDTASDYPHVAVAAFVNWPAGLAPVEPATVLPHAYRDSVAGFHCWRNRWRDADDTVITVLTNETRGYMGAPAERTLSLNSRGRRLTWGTVTEGPPRHWSMSPQGETSALTLADGTAFGVDFSGASGADTLLVTTGRAEGEAVRVGGATLTFFFPTADRPPRITVEGDAAVAGEQRVRFADGRIVFAAPGR